MLAAADEGDAGGYGREGGQKLERGEDQRPSLPEHRERRVLREGRSSRQRLPRTFLRAEEVAGADELRAVPQDRHQHEKHGDQCPRAWVAAPQVERVEAEERPRLRPDERCGEDQDERGAQGAVEVALDGDEHRRSDEKLRPSAPDALEEAVDEQHAAGGDEAGEDLCTWGKAGGDTERRRDGDDPRCAHDDEPECGRGAAEDRQDGRDGDRERLEGRPVRRAQVEVRGLASPDDPGPGVVRGGAREDDEGDRGDRQRCGHEDEERVRGSRPRDGMPLRRAALDGPGPSLSPVHSSILAAIASAGEPALRSCAGGETSGAGVDDPAVVQAAWDQRGRSRAFSRQPVASGASVCRCAYRTSTYMTSTALLP